MSTPINRPGAPTNPPQHTFDQGADERDSSEVKTAKEGAHRQTGPGTAPPGRDIADPHPADEEHPFRERAPGGANPPSDVPIGNDDVGPNPARHNGKAPPRPHNAGSGPD